MLARTVTHTLVGIDPRRVEVEAHIQGGIPAFAIVGLADRACQEAKARVRSSVAAAELAWPPSARVTINLAPAALRKEGSGFDLPIALAVLAASYQVPARSLEGHAAFGELGLDGRDQRAQDAARNRQAAVRIEPYDRSCASRRKPAARRDGSPPRRSHETGTLS